MLCNNKVRLFTSSYQGLPVITHLYVRFIPAVEKAYKLAHFTLSKLSCKGRLAYIQGVSPAVEKI